MKWLKRVAVLCTVALLGTVAAAQPASAADPPYPPSAFENDANLNLCLLMQVGHNASIWNCANYADQNWNITNTSLQPSHLIIQNDASGYCLGVNSLSNNAIVGPMQCDVSDNPNAWKTQWTFTRPPHGDFWVQNVYSQKCLLASGGQINVAVTQYTCMDYPDQEWFVGSRF
jgi:hypothetical protein